MEAHEQALKKIQEESEYSLMKQEVGDFIVEDDLIVGEINSEKVDHESLVSVYNHINNCINHIQQTVQNFKFGEQ